VSKTKTGSSESPRRAAESFDDAIAALARGEVIVFPTETLYGLGADALNDRAVGKVFQLKGRNPTSPIPVLVADIAMLDMLVIAVPETAKKLIDTFWPGPLTVVLPARDDIPTPLANANGGIGVRISSQSIASQLITHLGRPLTATSANPSGKEPACTVDEAKRYFSETIGIFIDGGPLQSKTGSTVVEVLNGKIRIIREGEVSAAALAQAIGQQNILR
jgi:tRNA threonylcarbamoyl adenosine modification protein (Sua5/YciO/YrdC/YwlC family)